MSDSALVLSRPPSAPWPSGAIPEYEPLPLPPPMSAPGAGPAAPMAAPWAVCGARRPPAELALLGACTRAGEPVALSLDDSFAHGYFGVPGSGKSYVQGLLVEALLRREPALARLRRPACALSLPFPGAGYAPELSFAQLPNQDPEDGRRLAALGCRPAGLRDCVILTLPEREAELRRRYPYCQVHGIRFTLAELGLPGLFTLCGVPAEAEGRAALYGEQLAELLRGLPDGFTLRDAEAAAASFPFDGKRARALALQRLRLCRPYLDERLGLGRLLRPGRLIVVDLRDEWLPRDKALTLLELVVDVLVRRRPAEVPLLLCYDEVHRFARSPRVLRQLSHLVRERRHLGVRVAIASQDPLSVPRALLSELSAIGLFRCDAQRWIDHLRGDCAAFGLLRAADCAALRPGQMYFWAQEWLGPAELRGSLLRLQLRPRQSHHPGR